MTDQGTPAPARGEQVTVRGAPIAGRDRRPLGYAVLLCLAGAGLALFAATRVWAVEVTVRPDPLPAVRVARTGGDLLSWLPALALVGLAGAGAVLATRATVRRVVGGLLLVVGAGVAAGAGYTGLEPAAGTTGAGWPLLCVAGGLALAGGGALTALRGQRWAAMGARYERGGTPPPVTAADASAGPAPVGARAGRAGGPAGQGLVETWDALDRGEDPTLVGPDEPLPDEPLPDEPLPDEPRPRG